MSMGIDEIVDDDIDDEITSALPKQPEGRVPRHTKGNVKKFGSSFIVEARERRTEGKVTNVAKSGAKYRAIAVDSLKGRNVQAPKGVMRTHRIDSMLAARSLKKHTTAMVDCPVCSVAVAKLELNKHLESCVTPGMFSQDAMDEVCVPDSDDEIEAEKPPLSTKSTPKAEPREGNSIDMLRSSGHRNMYPKEKRMLDVSRRETYGSNLPRGDYDALKQMIPDPDMLMSLAVDPYSVNRESLLNAFHIPRDGKNGMEEGKSNDVGSILKPFMQKKSPRELQRKAREKMLRYVGKGKLVKEIVLHEFAAQRGMDMQVFVERVLSKARRKKDGNWVISEERLQQIQATPKGQSASGSTHHVDSVVMEESVLRKPRPWSNDGSSRPSSSDLLSSRPSTRTVPSRPTSRGVAVQPPSGESFADGVISMELRQERMENCPMCDVAVPRKELEEHVSRCLNETDVAPLIFSGDVTVAAEEQDEVQERRCPLCDCTVPRGQLERHVQMCMVSEGLENVF